MVQGIRPILARGQGVVSQLLQALLAWGQAVGISQGRHHAVFYSWVFSRFKKKNPII